MKYLKNKMLPILFLALVAGSTGCKKYIEETNLGAATDQLYYVTKQGFEDLSRSNYPNLRYIASMSNLYNLGTDTYSSLQTTDVNALNMYNVSLNSSLADVDNLWKQLYYTIGGNNTTLYWATQVQNMDAATLNARIGEAKAMRAYCYYLLAETFGDVPLVLTRTVDVSTSFSRTPESEVYTQIIKDLNEAIATLPVVTTDFGRITRGFAQHLLAKVYLTRGYKTYGQGVADFNQAASIADALINSGTYSLRPTFASMFDPSISNFQVNSEVIFSVQYSTNVASNQVYFLGKAGLPSVAGGTIAAGTAAVGNALQQYFLWDTSVIQPIGRSVLYNRPATAHASVPDPYFFSLFDKTRDSRYQATVWTALIAQTAGSANGKSFVAGDTVVYYPDVAFTTAQKATRKYYVFNPGEYRTTPFSGNTRTFPLFKKFRDPNAAFADNGGTRDTYIFRLGETYLLAAEASLQAGNLPKALQFFNAIRTRAAKTGTNPASGLSYAAEMQVTSLSLDDILDERARELSGEEFRWYELKRTGKLISRVLTYNDEAKASNTLKSFHLLRPIPQSQIDLNSGAAFPQNPGY
ncbi:RagB/SusD family nutrient uptake outer membrane protein [Pedobacter sp. R20-19]|uniref:RagB/SusD family nutrient uptake outer membrane protein n=1 Tax=Pedobacter sp. R20-19 TaxID=1270196 RepID=UPI00049358D2|nr:RagB/SusD family nutrient uptake outer membrane protein [Pedobacter sp. R20-19]